MGTYNSVHATVQHTYGEAARRARAGVKSDCCGRSGGWDPVAGSLYSASDVACLPAEAVLSSLGCGNPTALVELHSGETVLDLGSGGGIDVLLSARRVGPTGQAYGLDMTPEMVALSADNARQAGVGNAEFLQGEIEAIPLPDASVDVIISNCVINLSADKERTLREAFRVLKPGGRFAVSDVVVRGELPQPVRGNMALWVGCVAGALEEAEYLRLLTESGFVEPSIEPVRVYQFADAKALLDGAGLDSEVLAREISGRLTGAFIRARKPDEV
jgi:arsenite methyltransferase